MLQPKCDHCVGGEFGLHTFCLISDVKMYCVLKTEVSSGDQLHHSNSSLTVSEEPARKFLVTNVNMNQIPWNWTGVLLPSALHSTCWLHHSPSRLHSSEYFNFFGFLSIICKILIVHGYSTSAWKIFWLVWAGQNHHLRDDYDFDAYMVRCMEDEFQKIVGIR